MTFLVIGFVTGCVTGMVSSAFDLPTYLTVMLILVHGLAVYNGTVRVAT